jgi:hypothetical protein
MSRNVSNPSVERVSQTTLVVKFRSSVTFETTPHKKLVKPVEPTQTAWFHQRDKPRVDRPLHRSLPTHTEIPSPNFPNPHPASRNDHHLNLAVVQFHHIHAVTKATAEPPLIDPVSPSYSSYFARGDDKML